MNTIHFNENAKWLEGYPAEVVRFELPYFLYVKPQGCVDILRVTPGHFVEEDTIVAYYEIEVPDER